MRQLTTSPPVPGVSLPRDRQHFQTCRPALTDLRFKGDAYVVEQKDGTASLYLGNYPMLQIAVGPFDLPSLNRTLLNVRIGQARRLAYARRRLG